MSADVLPAERHALAAQLLTTAPEELIRATILAEGRADAIERVLEADLPTVQAALVLALGL